MVLTTFPPDPLLDLPAWVGQRSATFRFALTNRVTGENLGDITPIRGASLSHSTASTIKRQLNISLGVADTAEINPASDMVNVSMVLSDATEYPMGRYIFTDMSRQVFTSGKLGQVALTDEMTIVDQQITRGISAVGFSVNAGIDLALKGVPITYRIDDPANTFLSADAWGIGTSRGSIIEALATVGDYWSPWFDNGGILRFRRTFNPTTKVPDFDFDQGHTVLRSQILETDDLLLAPNTFIVISNASGGKEVSQAIVGRATVPDSAPNSVLNRGFEIVEAMTLPLGSNDQAQAVAQGIAERSSVSETVSLITAPDPRHDSYNVVRWQGANWLEIGWSMTLTEGGIMNHVLRKGNREGQR